MLIHTAEPQEFFEPIDAHNERWLELAQRSRQGAGDDRRDAESLELAAILAELDGQPRAAHDFFIKKQDRFLFGKNSSQPDEFPNYWRTFETGDEYFDYYRDYHAFWKLYGMALLDAVLRKLYYRTRWRWSQV